MTLSLQAHANDQVLSLDVEVQSAWQEPVYLMTVLEDWYGILGSNSPKITPHLAFVFFSGGQQALIVNGESAPPPRDVSLFAPRRPYAVKLDPAKKFRNTLQFSLPLLEWYAYREPDAANSAPEQVRSIRYRLEVVPASTTNFAKPLRTFPDYWQVAGKVLSLESVVELPKPVTLLRRLDADFKRLR